MQRLLLLLALCSCAGLARARTPDVDALVAQGLAAEQSMHPREALSFFLQAAQKAPDDPYILQKTAKQYSDLSDDIRDTEEARKLIRTALDYSNRALALAPNDAVNFASRAICYGKLAIRADNREKVEYSAFVKSEAEKAIAADPRYAWGYHILGCWNYEIASLGGVTRLFAKVAYGGLPSASAEAAVNNLKRACEIEPAVPAHRTELGFAYLASGDKASAKKEFQTAVSLSPTAKFDLAAQKRARSALEKLL